MTYKINDYNGEVMQGSFYELELKKTSHDVLRIEKVLKRKEDKSLVKWVGYSDTINSWIDTKSMVKLLYNLVQIKSF